MTDKNYKIQTNYWISAFLRSTGKLLIIFKDIWGIYNV